MAALAVVEVNGLKRMREEEEDAAAAAVDGDVAELDDTGGSGAPASKRQGRNDHRSDPPASSVLECISAVTSIGGGGEDDSGPTTTNNAADGRTTVLREFEECLVAEEEQVSSSTESAVSAENAARVLRSLEEELGLSAAESEDQTAFSSVSSSTAARSPPCAEAFAGWAADDVWNMHGFSSADLSVGCSSGSSLTGDDLVVCERFDVLPVMLNQGIGNVPVDIMSFPIAASNEGPSSSAAPTTGFNAGFDDDDVGRLQTVLSHGNTSSLVPAAAASPAVETLESLQNSVSWALEEGFDDYSGFSGIAVGDEWMMTPVDNLDFLLDSTTADATISSPFVEEAAPL